MGRGRRRPGVSAVLPLPAQPASSNSPHTLATLVHDCTRSGVGRHVLLLRLDALAPAQFRPEQRIEARDAVEGLTRADRALLHDLPSGAVAVSWKGEAELALDEAMTGLLRVFEGTRTPPLDTLIRQFELPQDASMVLQITDAAPLPPLELRPSLLPQSLQALGSTSLDELEQLLGAADIARFVRRTPVCRRDGEVWLLAWEKRFLSVPEITETLTPGCDITADAWLFRRLTRVLDRRMLALLAAPRELDGAGPFSLDLNVASILGPAFLRFDAVLPAALRGQIVLNLSLSDIVSDPSAYAFARSFAQGRGYRIMLREVTDRLLPLISLPTLELDHTELVWSPALAALLGPTNPARPGYVLAAAHSTAALAWAAQQGISLAHGKGLSPTGPIIT